jgi:hypothetical protein
VQKDIIRAKVQVNSTGMLPAKKVNKTEEQTHLSINIGVQHASFTNHNIFSVITDPCKKLTLASVSNPLFATKYEKACF